MPIKRIDTDLLAALSEKAAASKRLRTNHNCWTNDCESDAQEMEDAIREYANLIQDEVIGADLVISRAVRLVDGTIASGGNRYENDQIALWEFKTGDGNIAYDTSGIAPDLHLSLSGDIGVDMNFTTTESVSVSPAPVPATEATQAVSYTLSPLNSNLATLAIDPKTGKVLAKRGSDFTLELFTDLRAKRVREALVFTGGPRGESPLVRNTLAKDPTSGEAEALRKMYSERYGN